MVNIALPQICPYCKEQTVSDDPDAKYKWPHPLSDRCPHCMKIIKNPDNKYFEPPKYIFHQKKSLIENLENDKLKPEEEDYQLELHRINKAEVDWHRDCLHEYRVGALSDALGVIQHLPYTRSAGDEVIQLLNLAEKIGNMVSAIRTLYKSGVSLYDREPKQIRAFSGSLDGNQASATASRDP